MRLKHKFAVFTSVWLIAILVFVDVFVGFQFIRLNVKSQVDTLYQMAQNIEDVIGIPTLLSGGQDKLLRKHLPPNGMIRIIDHRNRVLSVVLDELSLQQIPPQFSRTLVSEYRTIQAHTDEALLKDQLVVIVRSPLYLDTNAVGTLEIASRQVPMENSLQILIYVLVLSSLGAIALSVFGGLLVSRYVIKPVTRMTETMEEVESSMSFKRLPLPGKSRDELYTMTMTFNRMMDRLEEGFVKQQQFVSDASHEFKTMLTIIESYASMLRRWGMKDQKVLEESIEAIYNESVRMKKMTQQLLELASTGNESVLAYTRFNLVQTCRESADLMERLYSREIKVVNKGDVIIEADKMKIKQLLMILLDNALKYSQRKVEIQVRYSGLNSVFIRIVDYGIGIPKDELKHVFERFYRVDKARQRKTGGTGLGLSIAKSLVNQHKGSIHMASEENRGTEVTVYLPRRGYVNQEVAEPVQQETNE